MILNYNDIGHKNLEEYKKEKIEIKVFKPKQFDEYKEEMEKRDISVSVVRNTKLKELKEDSEEVKKGEYLVIADKKYKVIKERGRVAVGYIPIDESRFVRIESNLLIFILLFGLGALLIGSLLIPIGGEEPIIPLPDIEMDSGADDWDGEGNKTGEDSVAEQENTIIPGFSTFKATKEASLIKLYNFPENTVNFVYTITKEINNEKVKEFELTNEDELDNITIVQKFITDNTITYENYYDESTNNYLLKDQYGELTDVLVEYKVVVENDKYVVYKHESEVIYFTKGIAPNKSVDWNAYESLGVGVHKVQFRIAPYDVETNALTYGAIQDVTITIIE